MEMDKLKKWLELTQKFQGDSFWEQIFDENSVEKVKNNHSIGTFTKIQSSFPKCDLYETNEVLIIEAEIPGLRKEDLHITVIQQLLTITGEFKTLKEGRKYFIKERANRTFKKELILPYPVMVNNIRTEIRNGVLVILMPVNKEEIETIPISFDQQSSE
ncbi:hypothetical protein BIV60_11320 [Bacillus sp. MUM 116]|uniref:Hsp20/alpha crystallin family protein n=1 Tax=Bacillus sp. MUM 116 TaxID=1678002 RepID=UPI0008F5ED62|nr:Hsp20/alpha crystallin family protein [Bacillus sp. MUM 116]OIK14549.1 hypothetical protein BIV60_11320 [Bacillus sp. MUM 116]